MNRRNLLKFMMAGVGSYWARDLSAADLPPVGLASSKWRGFNLLSMIDVSSARPFPERDFRLMRDWGFNFARLPLDYRCWVTDMARPRQLTEQAWRYLDAAIAFGDKYGIHINLSFHRAPGYSVKLPKEPRSLWDNTEVADDFCWIWGVMAQRYLNIPSERLSFNLVNEPDSKVDATSYLRVMKAAMDAISAVDARRQVIVDGLEWGRRAIPTEGFEKVIQSARGYKPDELTHYAAGYWNPASLSWPVPEWPLTITPKNVWDSARLREEFLASWGEVLNSNLPIHVGEFGVYNKTPHDVTLAFMEDCLKLWREFQCGWALWNLEGSYGIINSMRADVDYQKQDGYLLDGAMLELLQKY